MTRQDTTGLYTTIFAGSRSPPLAETKQIDRKMKVRCVNPVLMTNFIGMNVHIFSLYMKTGGYLCCVWASE